MNKISLFILTLSLTFTLSAFDTPQKIREIVFLWESGKKEEALSTIEIPLISEREEFSYALYLFSSNLFKKGEDFYAKKFLKKALEINPDLYIGWSLLSFEELKSGNIHLFFKCIPRTFIAYLKDFKIQVIFFSILLKSLYLSILISLFILSSSLLLKYLPLVRDDLSRVIGNLALRSGKLLSYLVILFLPAFLFLGWALTSIIWIAFVWSFLKNNERKLVIIATLMVILGVIGNNISASLVGEIANFNTSENNNGQRESIYLLFSAKKDIERGEFEKAINTLYEVNKKNPNLFSLITLGNIRLKEGNYEESKKLYEEALMLFPNSNIPYSNLSILFEKTGETQYAEKYKEKAIALKGKVGELIWPELSNLYAWKYTLKKELSSKNILSSELFFILGICIIGVFLNVILKISSALYGESRFCLSCRKSINIHFDLKITNPDYCEECYRLFIWKPPELEIVRASKSKEIKRKRIKELSIYRVISIFIPYSGLIRYDNPSLGYSGLTLFVFLLSTGFLLRKIDPFAISFTFALLSVIIYIISIFIFEKKVKEEWKEL